MSNCRYIWWPCTSVFYLNKQTHRLSLQDGAVVPQRRYPHQALVGVVWGIAHLYFHRDIEAVAMGTSGCNSEWLSESSKFLCRSSMSATQHCPARLGEIRNESASGWVWPWVSETNMRIVSHISPKMHWHKFKWTTRATRNKKEVVLQMILPDDLYYFPHC